MTSSGDWVRVYLEVGGLLGLFWLLLALSDLVIKRCNWTTSAFSRLKTARFVFLLVFLSPILARILSVGVSPEVAESVYEVQQLITQAGAAGASAALNLAPAERWPSIDFKTAIVAFAFLVFSVFLFRFVARIAGLYGVVKRSHCRKKLGKVSVLVSAEIEVPFVTCLFGKSQIVIPESLLLSPEYLPIVVSHEGQHLRNGDANWELIMELCCLLFFWNPFAYGWKQRVSRLQELACDEVVLGRARFSRQQYGHCLLFVSRQLLRSNSAPIASSCMGRKSWLERRIHVIACAENPTSPGSGSLMHRLILGAITAATGVLVIACSSGLPVDAQRNIGVRTGIYSVALDSANANGIDMTLLRQRLGNAGAVVDSEAQLSTSLTFERVMEGLQEFGAVSHVSSPEISTLSGRSARINSGAEVPYQFRTENGAVSTRFLPVGIRLEVSPTIIGHDRVVLKIALVHTSAGAGIGEAPIAPESIYTSTIDSELKIRSGEIVVLTSREVATEGNASQLVMLIQASVL